LKRPLILTITPSNGMLRRYEGTKVCTHKAQLTEPLDRSLLEAIYRFMNYPDHLVDFGAT